MAEEDEEKTSFFTCKGIYCYKKMPFGLKNVGATYQRLVDKVFHRQLGQNLEAYVDDMVIKSREETYLLGETLYLYLAASKECISAVLVSERERRQTPIYFVSRVLQNAEANYPELEKLTLALVHKARKLRSYFQAHSIVVLTKKLIQKILTKTEKSGRMAKWAIVLGEHDIEFQARQSIKGQVLVEFMAEIATNEEEYIVSSTQVIVPMVEEEEWKLYTDGALSSDGSGAGLMLVNPEVQEFTYALHFEFQTTNNEAKNEALLAGLRLEKEMKIRHLRAFIDSQLVVNQVTGTFEARQLSIQ
ncbi:uncharacterized protein [Rutidosis leptorrhynchoides]|uniref:uncharacterized protein n=1 Tax=Rutidosis leptorrhynchoides TaxID=125765 RepID=UPI003A992156